MIAFSIGRDRVTLIRMRMPGCVDYQLSAAARSHRIARFRPVRFRGVTIQSIKVVEAIGVMLISELLLISTEFRLSLPFILPTHTV